MPNYRTRTINYTPRMDSWQALEAMPPALRTRVQEGWFIWDCYSILRQYHKLLKTWGPEIACRKLTEWLDQADRVEASKPWKSLDGHRIPSPYAALRVQGLSLEDLL